MSEQINHHRRRFFGMTAVALAAVELGVAGKAAAQSAAATLPAVKAGTNTSFEALKQVNAGVLDIGYAEAGKADGPVVLLLHGWPYDIYSFVDVAPLLVSAGYRVIVPYLRGYGTTRFLDQATARNGQPSALAADMIALLDALDIEKAVIAGYDWGGRTANIMAALWPERCKAMVSVSGYLIGSQEANKKPLPPKAELSWWYQFYFATERGVRVIKATPMISQSSSGRRRRRSGISTIRPSTDRQPPSTIPTMSKSSFTITAGASDLSKASPSMMTTRRGLLRCR